MESLGDSVLCSLSLFSGGGLGDLGISYGCDIPVISACEIIPSRASLIERNHPETRVFEGDVWELCGEIVQHALQSLDGRRPWLVTLSPPCQGMSSNGAGRISAAIKDGKRPAEDARNRLIIPGIHVLEQLQPDWFVLENVSRMENTVITNEKGEPENILDLLARRLNTLGYTIRSAIVEFQRLGVPHNRRRLITIGCRLSSVVEQIQPGEVFQSEPSFLHPIYDHDPITLSEAIGHLPPLDSISNPQDLDDEWHRVPTWNEDQYHWMSHTPEGRTAFDNDTCIVCETVTGDSAAVDCGECGEPLPRPQKVGECGNRRLIKGFRTSYRRLSWDKLASTLTMNSGVISSDMKGHPSQNRVLSLREILILSTVCNRPGVSYPWNGSYNFGKPIDNRLVRQVVGESIPPLAMARIVGRLIDLDPRLSSKTIAPKKT